MFLSGRDGCNCSGMSDDPGLGDLYVDRAGGADEMAESEGAGATAQFGAAELRNLLDAYVRRAGGVFAVRRYWSAGKRSAGFICRRGSDLRCFGGNCGAVLLGADQSDSARAMGRRG